MIILDNHLHLRRDGRFLEAVKEFQQAGGTHINLCQYPMVQLVLKEKTYEPCYQETFSMAEEIRKNTSVKVYCTIGPYPVDYIRLREELGKETALQIMKKGMNLAAEYCQQGKAIAIGEIGRPHFPVSEDILHESNEILIYGMQQAKDANVPVVLHTESTTPEQCKELANMGAQIGLPAHQIVKHFAPPLIFEHENHGLMPSVLASKKNSMEAIQKGTRFLMETDYIDDPRRPGAVLSPKTVPKRIKELLRQEHITEEEVGIIHKDNPEKTYHITLEE